MKTRVSTSLRSACVRIESLENRSLFSGGLDPTFGKDGILTDAVPIVSFDSPQLATEPDRTVIKGTVGVAAGRYVFDIRRLNVNGSADLAFGSKGVVQTAFTGRDAQLISLLVQPDGKIIAAGDLGAADNGRVDPTSMVVVRYNTNGSLDKGFGSAGIVTFTGDYDPTLALQNGKLLVQSANTLRRLSTNGVLDISFHSGNPGGVTIAVQSDGKIVTGEAGVGMFASGSLTRYSANGILDSTFGNAGTLTAPANPLALQIEPDGSIVTLVEGYIPHGFGATSLFAVTATGTADANFGTAGVVNLPELGPAPQYATAMTMQPDGKVIVVQAQLVPVNGFLPYGTGGTEVLRYTTRGALDKSFGSGGIADVPNISPPAGDEYQFGNSAALDNSGRLLIAASSMIAIETTNPVSATGRISGYMFYDFNGNGKRDSGDHALTWTCYIDANNDGHYDAGDTRIYTDKAGNFSIGSLTPGIYHIRQTQVAHWQKTTPAEYTVTVKAGESVTDVIFGSRYVG